MDECKIKISSRCIENVSLNCIVIGGWLKLDFKIFLKTPNCCHMFQFYVLLRKVCVH